MKKTQDFLAYKAGKTKRLHIKRLARHRAHMSGLDSNRKHLEHLRSKLERCSNRFYLATLTPLGRLRWNIISVSFRPPVDNTIVTVWKPNRNYYLED